MLAGLAGTASALAPVSIISPAPDSVVRGQVRIRVPTSAVPLTSPTPAYVVIFIDDKFEAAVARPRTGNAVTYVWDTKASSSILGSQQVEDGKHEIKVMVVGQNGQQIGRTDRVEVFVQNNVRTPPSQVNLRYRFNPGVQNTYVKRIQIRQNDQDVYKARLVLKRSVDDVMPGSVGMVRERIDRDSAQSDQGQPIPFPTAGQSVTFNQLPNGSYIPGLKMRRTGMRPALYMPILPAGPVKVGQTWTGAVHLAPMFQGIDNVTLPAESTKHTLESFEWQNNVPTAKITTTFNGNTTVVVQGAPALYNVNGTRTTYFDWRNGRVIKMIDDYALAAANTTGGGVFGTGTTGSAGPGYSSNPYARSGASSYPGGGASGYGGGTGDSSFMKVNSVTQLTG
ncbi:MAG: hypothetical protein KY468_01520 [Armatimonadetes bacterium]|nr:hypothetical protein [Armatimonadota bacterium]